MDPLILLPLLIGLGTVIFGAIVGLWAFRAGYRSGYRKAREVPIGYFRRWHVDGHGIIGFRPGDHRQYKRGLRGPNG